ncbi:MAG TPA: hypothetical protein VFW47_00955 [Phenylobacterium sp.]|nr:hypothetical protein [Phenylobacterium sp.]
MTRPDDRLAALFAADLPPARDPGFQAEVLEGLARRRFQADLMWLASAAVVSGAALWLLWPVVAPTLEALGRGLAPGAMALAVAASIVILATGRTLLPRS